MTAGESAAGHDRCGAKTRSGGKCGRPAGWGTTHVGTGTCKLHLGSVTTHNRKAQTILAEEACGKLGIPHEGVHPAQALLAELWECEGNISFYRREIQRLESRPEDGRRERGEPGIYGRTYHQSGIPTGEAKPHVLVVLYERERDRKRAVAVELLRAGVEERRVKMAEADASWINGAIATALVVMGLEERLDEFRSQFAAALSQDGPGPSPLSAGSPG